MEIELKNYRITESGSSADKEMRVPGAIADEMGDLYLKCIKGKTSVKERLVKLIGRYPNVPQLKYFLVKWHLAKDNKKIAGILIDELIQSYPDFVLARSQKIETMLACHEL